MSNVKLAVRVRPFNEREHRSEKDRLQVVNVTDEHTVTITNMKVNLSGAGDSRERVRRYYADYTFDSACSMNHPSYASQEKWSSERTRLRAAGGKGRINDRFPVYPYAIIGSPKVFESIGREVIASVSRGCSACVMAYGQSATGKTHTMMGTDEQPGLVPRLCRAFADLQQFDLTISFLEIYNERVHDLLAGEAPQCHSLPRRLGNARKDLRVREHPSKGPYVQNLRRVAIHDVEALLSLVSEGASRRRTAATRRNSTSSRSHALLEISSPRATLHLADLAGSEKASWEVCGGSRQKEGANINKSLVALSNVISALVSGGIRARFVPYRDSALTWLLKDCFTGGASTFIITTVSPSVACYGESASTLRWAARARQLPTPRNINSSPNIASRAVLQAQFNQLLAELTANHIRYIPETGKISFDIHHWRLRTNEGCQSSDTFNTAAKIGNIMNIKHPKPDASIQSTASSVASRSSDVINNAMDINIANEINKEVDKLFGPALERTSSGSDLKVVAPLRHKRRQYRSQEVLPLDESLIAEQSPNIGNTLPSHIEIQINDLQNANKSKIPHVSILHENQRAEIVASVTERLYSKLKKKEDVVSSRMEPVVDKKYMEPLNELKICTNARQRLMELSQKALRNKRRIGIPAYTQTRVAVIRVKDQGTDVQTDLEAYIVNSQRSYTLYRDVATETMPMTPRFKEKAVGSEYGTLDFNDRSTATESNQAVLESSYMMTDVLVTRERCTQTPIVPPPRRKKYISNTKRANDDSECLDACSVAPVISINISQTYPVDSESFSSDSNSDSLFSKNYKLNNVTTTPDLLTNHCDVDTNKEQPKRSIAGNLNKKTDERKITNSSDSVDSIKQNEEFPDYEDYFLPRVSVDPTRKVNYTEIKDMILGRNENIYPYNIVISPAKDQNNSKRIVTFKDIDTANETNGLHTSFESNNCYKNVKLKLVSDEVISAKDTDLNESNYSDSTESSKSETDSFIWKQGDISNKAMGCLRKKYTPIYKSNPRYRTANARFCKDILGIENSEDVNHNRKFYTGFRSYENVNRISSSESTDIENGSRYQHRIQKLDQFTDKRKQLHPFDIIERKLFASCNDLEMSVNKYKKYLGTYRKGGTQNYGKELPIRTPTEYMQHLVKLRREVVKAEADTNTDSSLNISQS